MVFVSFFPYESPIKTTRLRLQALAVRKVVIFEISESGDRAKKGEDEETFNGFCCEVDTSNELADHSKFRKKRRLLLRN